MSNEIILTESKTLRNEHLDKTAVLDKVGYLATLPGDTLATLAGVAEFYGVTGAALTSVIRRHRDELEENGLRTLKGEELQELRALTSENFDSVTPTTSNVIGSKARSFTVVPRRAVLNIGMLLTESEVAKAVRSYLLEVEELAPVDVKEAAILRLVEKREYKELRKHCVLGGWQSGDYARLQVAIYETALHLSVGDIKAQPQTTGIPRKDGNGFRKSTVAKDFLTDDQRDILGDLTSAMLSAAKRRYPNGMTFAEAIRLLQSSADFIGL